MTAPRALLLLALGIFTVSACNGRSERRAPSPRASAAISAGSREKPQVKKRTQPAPPLEQFVQQHVEEADAEGMRVLVYVGATWCEPCKVFHQALASGELDEVLAGTKFVEFDVDRDGAELRAAGYAAKYIPFFSVPEHSGHSSGRAIEGSIKSNDAVKTDLVPRLVALLDGK